MRQRRVIGSSAVGGGEAAGTEGGLGQRGNQSQLSSDSRSQIRIRDQDQGEEKGQPKPALLRLGHTITDQDKGSGLRRGGWVTKASSCPKEPGSGRPLEIIAKFGTAGTFQIFHSVLTMTQ